MQSRNCINCDVIKSKHSEEVVGKIRSKLQITHLYVCKFHFNITDINVSAGRHIETAKCSSLSIYLNQKVIIRKSTKMEISSKTSP